MEIITVLGKLSGAPEVCKDKNGHSFLRFKVFCNHGKEVYTSYRCMSYNIAYKTLIEGDSVLLIGDLLTSIKNDENGKVWVNRDIMVRAIEKVI